ncbi:F-box family protein [Quillaja saponaria]|uniref:F-box family protein n=1 Tax=Quillaja saponaria TaxID=32244 RepID=A0AAD7LPN9_QUISA|nr:F-box family protein [Quillaja saponaria]
MKRKRTSTASGNQKCNGEVEKFNDPEIQRLVPSFTDLPRVIMTHILLRLPLKSILICRCVCKTWDTLISVPEFAKLHFEDAPVELMIRTDDPKRVSRALYLVEFEPEMFVEDGSCSCEEVPSPNCKSHVKLETKLKLPLRDAKMVIDKRLNVNGENPYCCVQPSNWRVYKLPEADEDEKLVDVASGFGFCLKTNQYKVIRVYQRYIYDPKDGLVWWYDDAVADVYTLGSRTESWRIVGSSPSSFMKAPSMEEYNLEFPTCLNGSLHWFCPKGLPVWLSFNIDRKGPIVCFNFESEKFQTVPSPLSYTRDVSMGELRGCLYICRACSSFSPTDIWVMEKYGVRESWTKILTIKNDVEHPRPRGVYQPIKYMKNGTILMYHSSNCLIYYDPCTYAFKYRKEIMRKC